jgi:chromosome segregation ATPase
VAKFIPVEPEKWAEMVKAQAEVERLNVQVETLRNLGIKLESMIDPLVSENARLKAEVERLTKAGNNLVYCVSEHPVSEQFVKAWFAAKNGGQP